MLGTLPYMAPEQAQGDLSSSSPARGSSSSGRPRAPTDEMFAHGVQLMKESLGDSLPADKCLELLRARPTAT